MENVLLSGKLSVLGLQDNFDRLVAVITDDNSLLIDGCIYVCLTQEALQSTADMLMEKRGKKHGCVKVPLACAIYDVFFMSAEKIAIYGLIPQPVILNCEELIPLKEAAECYVYMNDAANKRNSVEDSYEKMKDKYLYVQGCIDVSDKMSFNVLNRKDETTGKQYQSLMAYLTYEHAVRKNENKYPINRYKLCDLRKFFGNVIVEPDEHYWFEVRKG